MTILINLQKHKYSLTFINDAKGYSASHCFSPPGKDRDTTMADKSPIMRSQITI